MTSVIACLTPPGTGALATLGLLGPAAWPAIRELFRPVAGALPEVAAEGKTWFGRLGDGAADEVVLAVTGGRVEVHCHGGPQVVAWLIEAFAARGLTPCDWPTYQRLAFGDSIRTLALERLAFARTVRTAAILLDQANGALEAVTDPELALRYADVGRHLTEPWRVVVAGPPNAGKSSLTNALAGFQRSVVAPVPGTTRDVVTVQLAVDGWPIELADTAGLRDAPDELERAGVQLAEEALTTADLVLWLYDAAGERLDPPAGVPVLTVLNKADLPLRWDVPGAVRVSAATGAGLDELLTAIAARLVPDPPPPGAPVPFTPELIDRFRRA